MVSTTVAELQFVGFPSQGQTEELMSQADAKDGDFADELLNVGLGVGHRLGISGSVGKHDPVETGLGDFIGMSRGRIDDNVTAEAGELPEDIFLDSVVVNGDARARPAGIAVNGK